MIRKFYVSYLISGIDSLETALAPMEDNQDGELCRGRKRYGDICCYQNERILDVVRNWTKIIEGTKDYKDVHGVNRYCRNGQLKSPSTGIRGLYKWCKEVISCKGICIKNTDLLSQELVPLLVMQNHPLEYPIQNMAKLFTSWAASGDPHPNGLFRVPSRENIGTLHEYMSEVEAATGIHALKFWHFINQPYTSESFKKYFLVKDGPDNLYNR